MLRSIIQDFRYGSRLLSRSPASSAIAVLALAVGVGINVAVFSVVNAVLLRSLPFRDADRLVILHQARPDIPKFPVSYPDYLDWKAQATSFAGMGAYTLRSRDSLALVYEGRPVQIQASLITHDLFSLMGIAPVLGRSFLPEEEAAGHDQFVILSHRIWQHHFGSSEAIIGKGVEIAGTIYTVVGIMGPREQFPEEADVWMPISRMDRGELNSRGARRLWVVGRLKPGVSETQSITELQSIMRRLSEAYPAADKNVSAVQVNLLNYYTGNVQRILLVLLGAATLVLLIACANLANLLLGRGVLRRRELAVRAALGATRARIIRQLLAESFLLAAIGTFCGLLMASGASYFLRRWLAATSLVPRLNETNIDLNVLAYALGVAVFTTIVFGTWPAVKSSRIEPNEVLKEAGKGAQSSLRERTRRLIIAAEVAVAVIVIVSATLLMRSLREVHSVNPGFRTSNILTVELALPSYRYPDSRRSKQFFQQLLEKARALPGVKAAATINILPIVPSLGLMHFAVEGAPPEPIGQRPIAQIRTVSPGYFELMGIPIKKGRSFSEADTAEGASPCFIINESLARKFFPDVDPIGRGLVVVEAPTPFTVPVIGVVADVKDLGLTREPEPEIYGVGYMNNDVLLLHTSNDPLASVGPIRAAVQEIDPLQPLGSVSTMHDVIAKSLAQRSVLANLMMIFSGLALLLSVIGVYGVTAYAVAQRTPEIGVRMAVGARASDILRLLLRDELLPVGVGVAVGIGGAWALRNVLSGFLYGVSPSDVTTYILVTAGIMLAAFVAILVASRRVLRLDPQIALSRP